MSFFVPKLENKYEIPLFDDGERFTLGEVENFEDELEEVDIEEYLKGEINGSTESVNDKSSK